jgi:hypothetical protein
MRALFFLLVFFAALVFVNSGCSGTSTHTAETNSKNVDTSSTPQPFDPKSLSPGKRYVWKGPVTINGEVLVGTETDDDGGVISYLANVTNLCENRELLGKSNKVVIVEGVLSGITTGLTTNQRPYGGGGWTNKQLALEDCKIRFIVPE